MCLSCWTTEKGITHALLYDVKSVHRSSSLAFGMIFFPIFFFILILCSPTSKTFESQYQTCFEASEWWESAHGQAGAGGNMDGIPPVWVFVYVPISFLTMLCLHHPGARALPLTICHFNSISEDAVATIHYEPENAEFFPAVKPICLQPGIFPYTLEQSRSLNKTY